MKGIMGTGSPLVCWVLLSLSLAGCSGLQQLVQPRMVATSDDPQAIIAPAQPFRSLALCLDTPPIYSEVYFRKAANAMANLIDQSINVNFGGMAVWASYINSSSHGDNALAFSIPPIPADPVKPQETQGTNVYPVPNQVQAYQQQLTTWKQQVIANHRYRDQVRATVNGPTQKLRDLPDRYDGRGADVIGCVADAAHHLKQMQGAKYLVVASAMLNTTPLQEAGHIDLSGVTVQIVWWACPSRIPVTCQASQAAWTALFEKWGVRAHAITFKDPPESDVSPPHF